MLERHVTFKIHKLENDVHQVNNEIFYLKGGGQKQNFTRKVTCGWHSVVKSVWVLFHWLFQEIADQSLALLGAYRWQMKAIQGSKIEIQMAMIIMPLLSLRKMYSRFSSAL